MDSFRNSPIYKQPQMRGGDILSPLLGIREGGGGGREGSRISSFDATPASKIPRH